MIENKHIKVGSGGDEGDEGDEGVGGKDFFPILPHFLLAPCPVSPMPCLPNYLAKLFKLIAFLRSLSICLTKLLGSWDFLVNALSKLAIAS